MGDETFEDRSGEPDRWYVALSFPFRPWLTEWFPLRRCLRCATIVHTDDLSDHDDWHDRAMALQVDAAREVEPVAVEALADADPRRLAPVMDAPTCPHHEYVPAVRRLATMATWVQRGDGAYPFVCTNCGSVDWRTLLDAETVGYVAFLPELAEDS